MACKNRTHLFVAPLMLTAPLPPNEDRRLARLQELGVLDTLPEKTFDDISALAQAICGTPIALITLVDRDRQWFKSRIGVDVTETPREVAFCAHTILDPEKPMVVSDALLDERFHDNALVVGDPKIRFYAGSPIVTQDGFALGSLCVFDQQPREMTPEQLTALSRLSDLVATLLEHEKNRRQENARNAAAAEREHEQLTAMVVAGLDLLVYLDTNGVYQHVNDTFLDYWACTREQVIGSTLDSLVGAQTYHELIRPKMELALAGMACSYQRVTDFPGRGRRHVHVDLLPAFGANGRIIGVVMRAQDIQEARQRELHLSETVALLEQKTRQQERFIHMLSHDLREPINAINNFTGLLQTDHSQQLPPEAQKYLDFVHEGGLRVQTLLDDLLRFMQLDKRPVLKKPVDLAGVLERVVSDLYPLMKTRGGSVDAGALPYVQGDENLLRELLHQVVKNGLQYVPVGLEPRVRVTAEQENGFDLIHVDDNGIGIAPERQDAVFGMLKRLQLRRQHPGSGLGLSMARRIAVLHGGSLTLISEPGRGSRFTLRLPWTDGPAAESFK